MEQYQQRSEITLGDERWQAQHLGLKMIFFLLVVASEKISRKRRKIGCNGKSALDNKKIQFETSESERKGKKVFVISFIKKY